MPADDRRVRDPHVRPDPARRRGRLAAGAVRARRQHGVPGLRVVPAHDGGGQRGVRPQGEACRQGRTAGAGERGARHGAALRVRRAQAGAALRRPAAAGRARPGARQPAPGPAPGRAARRARSQAPPGDADRAEGDPAVGRPDVHLRHARPGGSADDERPAGRVQPRADRAGGDARPRSTSVPPPGSWRGSSACRTSWTARRHGRSPGDEHAFTIRPEKIALKDPGAAVGPTSARHLDTSARSYTWVPAPGTSCSSTWGASWS